MKLKTETTGAGLSGAAQSIIQSIDAPFIGFTSSRFQSYGVGFKDEEALIKQHQKVTDLQRALKRKRHTIRSQASRLKELKVEIEELNQAIHRQRNSEPNITSGQTASGTEDRVLP